MISSCYSPRYVYSPSAHNVPILIKKNDVKIGINYSNNILGTREKNGQKIKQHAFGYDAQAAWAVTKKWAVQAGYYSRKERNDGSFLFSGGDSVVLHYKRKLWEAGIGYYTRLRRQPNTYFQFFAGAGSGEFSFADVGRNADSSRYHNFFSSKVTKYFIQPAFINSMKKGRVTAAFSSRFSVLSFHKVQTDYSNQDLDNYRLAGLAGNLAFFWEPCVVNSYGFNKIPGLRLEWQAGFSFLMSRRFVDTRSFNFSAGILIDPTKVFHKKANGN